MLRCVLIVMVMVTVMVIVWWCHVGCRVLARVCEIE